jgi:hypothetical protein
MPRSIPSAHPFRAIILTLCLAGCAAAPESPPTPAGQATAPRSSPTEAAAIPGADYHAIAAELIAMADADQAVRGRLITWLQANPGQNPPADIVHEMSEIDEANAARVKAIVDEIGWPVNSAVGSDASGSAWLIVQHAVHDLPLMQRALALMEPHLGTGEIDDKDYALLYDRVNLQIGRPQRWGTQCTELLIDGVKHFGVQPIEDPAGVDARRAAIGLPPLAEYLQRIRRSYGVPDDVPEIPRDMTIERYNAIVAEMRARRPDGGQES